MFTLFDTDKDGLLRKKEFQDGLCRLFTSSYEENLRLVYDLLDFDSDDLVSKEDVRTLLSHVPLVQLMQLTGAESPREGQYTQHGGGTYVSPITLYVYSYFFLDRLESQAELVKLLERCMRDRDTLTLEEFATMTEKVSSSIFLCVSAF